MLILVAAMVGGLEWAALFLTIIITVGAVVCL